MRRLLTLYALPFGSYTTAHHDWHHEKNCKNYALAFTYLDRLGGTEFAGRPLAPTTTASTTTTPPTLASDLKKDATLTVTKPLQEVRYKTCVLDLKKDATPSMMSRKMAGDAWLGKRPAQRLLPMPPQLVARSVSLPGAVCA